MLSADEYRAIFEAAPDGIVVVNHDGIIRDVNPQMESLFGYAREELLGEPVEILVPTALRSKHEAERARYHARPRSRPMGAGLDLTARRKDGTVFPVEISLSPWPAENRVFTICTIRDVSIQRRLQDFSAGALRSAEEERQRIARELHDDTAQRLATLLLRVRALAREDDPAARAEQLERLRAEILETAEGVKRIARGLRPPELEEVGLVTALQAHFRNLREGASFTVDAEMEPVDHLLDDEAKLALYRVIQEALSNARRHSGTDRATLLLRADGERITAVVEDEGRGFNAAPVLEREGGLGLLGMQERAVMIGGRVVVESTPGQGTRVRVDVPVNATEMQNV